MKQQKIKYRDTNREKIAFIKLVEWPINICAFELAFGCGIGKALSMFPGRVPDFTKIIILFLVAFISAYVVYRYMPVNSINSEWLEILFVNTSLILSTFVPILSILFYNTLIFWIALVIIAAVKTIISLELKRRESEHNNISFTDENIIYFRNEGLKLLFSKNPDAYALGPIPTSFLMALASVGIMLFKVNTEYSTLGIYIAGGSVFLYIILSTISRVYKLSQKAD